MKFTDVFINKPVLAIVVSALILVLGLRALGDLSVRQYPKTENAVVTVSTAYFGADARAARFRFLAGPRDRARARGRHAAARRAGRPPRNRRTR